jgi:hypothetical protein
MLYHAPVSRAALEDVNTRRDTMGSTALRTSFKMGLPPGSMSEQHPSIELLSNATYVAEDGELLSCRSEDCF